ncbi:YcbK family protein [uncultured Methylobacterium sp.]|uniref:YcbK family protein n=1 Tax=uncultured Methylobacterium sp. TaxID=157278 RepID=UPI0035CB4695
MAADRRAEAAGRDRLWLVRPDGAEIRSRFRQAEGAYDQDQVLLLSWFMRDVRDAERAVWMEPRLFDLMAAVQASMSTVHGNPLPLVVTSGYRTRAHNAAIETAARNSMHLFGYAADLQVRGYLARAVALAASFFSHGGIGLYDTFTHLDVWRQRTWIEGKAGTAAGRVPVEPPAAGP